MSDSKEIVQEYLINTKAPDEVLKAFRSLDLRIQNLGKKFDTAIKDQRSMAFDVIRAEKGEYPCLAITPWLVALETLVSYRESFWWMLEYAGNNDVDEYAKVARALLKDRNISYRAMKLIESALLEDANCDHSVGVCACAIREALGLE